MGCEYTAHIYTCGERRRGEREREIQQKEREGERDGEEMEREREDEIVGFLEMVLLGHLIVFWGKAPQLVFSLTISREKVEMIVCSLVSLS
jgi:hypothetical protein